MADWSEYKAHFIAEDGRVIDRANKGITHSESIGYALFLSLKNNDMDSFYKIQRWYKDNLTLNKSGLLGWKWGKDSDDSWRMLDLNNATDGDLWIAYDNLLMYEKTHDSKYKDEALNHIKSIKKYLLYDLNNRLYLLPGENGFVKNEYLEINLSYYLFFIFDKFKEYDNDIVWVRIKEDGLKLLEESKFTPLQLHPDWIKVDKNSSKIMLSKNSSFGYDALRIPYNILKSNIKNKNKYLEPYKNYRESMKKANTVFGVVDLHNGNINIYNYSLAHLSIYNMLDKYFNYSESLNDEVNKFKEKMKDDYYSYSIYLLATTN